MRCTRGSLLRSSDVFLFLSALISISPPLVRKCTKRAQRRTETRNYPIRMMGQQETDDCPVLATKKRFFFLLEWVLSQQSLCQMSMISCKDSYSSTVQVLHVTSIQLLLTFLPPGYNILYSRHAWKHLSLFSGLFFTLAETEPGVFIIPLYDPRVQSGSELEGRRTGEGSSPTG